MFPLFNHLAWRVGFLTTVVSLLTFTVVLGGSGDLDSTFDNDGLVTTDAVPFSPDRWDGITSVAIQADGKIVAVGKSDVLSRSNADFAVARYNIDGSLDSSFHTDGRLITDFGGDETTYAVALQPNGKIVVAGQTCASFGDCDIALARYNRGGALDITFSGDGKQTANLGTNGSHGSHGGLAIQSDGKIVVAGYMPNGTDQDFVVFRYLSNGTLDTTFSGEGKAKINFGTGRNDIAEDLVIQSDGKIVIAGGTFSDGPSRNYDFAVARMNSNGSLDTTFSSNGKQTTNFGADDIAHSVTLEADGKIVLAGEKHTSTAPSIYFAIARYNANGSLDTTFNGTGKKAFSVIPGVSSRANHVIVQSNGMIVMMGWAGTDFALARLNPAGVFDTTFSNDGKFTIEFGGYDFGGALALQPLDGKYVLAGSTGNGTQSDFALARVLP